MRVIKFRAWDNRQKEMYANALPCLTEGIAEVETAEEGMPAMTIISNAILMQFTGLLDKNGKEIYEGDIIEAFGVRYEVQWVQSRSGAGFNYGYPDKHNGSAPYWVEVVGNIYEHPQLLTPETIAQ